MFTPMLENLEMNRYGDIIDILSSSVSSCNYSLNAYGNSLTDMSTTITSLEQLCLNLSYIVSTLTAGGDSPKIDSLSSSIGSILTSLQGYEQHFSEVDSLIDSLSSSIGSLSSSITQANDLIQQLD